MQIEKSIRYEIVNKQELCLFRKLQNSMQIVTFHLPGYQEITSKFIHRYVFWRDIETKIDDNYPNKLFLG